MVSRLKPENALSGVFFFLRIYVLLLAGFSAYRLALFLREFASAAGTSPAEVLQAFVMGVRFDIVISSYLLALPFVVLSLASFFPRIYPALRKAVFYYIVAVSSVALLVCAADIPYYNQFRSRFSVGAFLWFDSPVFVFKMIAQEPLYWMFILVFLASAWLFCRLLVKVFAARPFMANGGNAGLRISVSVLFLGLMAVGTRGRLEKKSPIRIGTAYFCSNAFLNQLGLNPNFTLARSWLESRDADNRGVQLMDPATALANVRSYLSIKGADAGHPLKRSVSFGAAAPRKLNVVIVLMEAMSAGRTARGGETRGLTPFLDGLSRGAYRFDNAYASGIHTYNGVFSTLFSYPALFRHHPMKGSSMLRYNGLASALKSHGYSTLYFTTNDSQFDNVEGFLKNNDFEAVISQKDYPSSEVKTTLGVPDDYMFRYSIPALKRMYERGQNFLAVYELSSNHKPFYIPEYFKPVHARDDLAIVEYSDYSLRTFIEAMKTEGLLDDTVFVITGDHGESLGAVYDIPLNYVHVPLIFYSPKLIKSAEVSRKPAGQIDVFPSVMGLLRLPYAHETLGIDLFREERPYIFFNYDDKYGVIDDESLLIVKTDGSKGLYKYRSGDRKNYATEVPETVKKMQTYAESNLQSFQYLLNRR